MSKKGETFLNPESLTFLHILFDNNQVNAFEIHLSNDTDLTHFDRIDPELELTLKFTGLHRDSAFNGNAVFNFEKLEIGSGAADKKAAKNKEKTDSLKQENDELKEQIKALEAGSGNADENLSKATSEIERLTKDNEGLLKQIDELNQQLTTAKSSTDANESGTTFKGNKSPSPASNE